MSLNTSKADLFTHFELLISLPILKNIMLLFLVVLGNIPGWRCGSYPKLWDMKKCHLILPVQS